MTRRAFVILIVVAMVGAALAGVRLFRKRSAADAIKAIVRKRLAHLKMGEQDQLDFAEDFLSFHSGSAHHRTLRLLGPVEPLYEQTELLRVGPFASTLENLERTVATDLLLSSDFFSRERDTARVTKYVSFYNPYETPCRNPLARF